jgi:hypothetical protein
MCSIITEHIKIEPSDFIQLMGHAKATTEQPTKGEVVYLKEKGDNNMSMEIKADRVRIYKITEINMLSQVDLPSEYLAKPPHCYKTTIGNGMVLRYIDHKTNSVTNVFLKIDDEITEQEFQFIANMIRIAGKRLHKINHKNDTKKIDNKEKEAIEWTGSYTFEA